MRLFVRSAGLSYERDLPQRHRYLFPLQTGFGVAAKPQMSPQPERAKRVSVSLPPDLYGRLAALAEEDRRSVASWAAVQLELAVIEAEEKLRQGRKLKDRLEDESQRFTAWYRDESLAEKKAG